MSGHCYQLVVLGSGPAGQKAAVQGAKAGRQVAIVDRFPTAGGACVHRGTIPSKTLRESALDVARLRRGANVFRFELPEELRMTALINRMNRVVEAHAHYMEAQLDRNGVERIHGRARFLSPHDIEITGIDGYRRVLTGETIVIATGSEPRACPDIPVDHEHILDSDSILAMNYLPRSLTILGGGVVASEYASVFSLLGCRVVMIDKRERPLGFMDAELVDHFLEGFQARGGIYLGDGSAQQMGWDGVSKVVCKLDSGLVIESDKALVALGRTANLSGLGIQAAGLTPTEQGLLKVDRYCRTAADHIYAVGDVVGAPGLASAAMEQGRRAVCHSLGIESDLRKEMIPVGIFTIPEMASVGITEEKAGILHGGATVGRAPFKEIARGQISGANTGLLKLVVDPRGEKLLGVQIVGEGATELIHVGQMALLAGFPVDTFVENIFNFPTFAEAYRVAALDIVNRRRQAVCCRNQARQPSAV